MSLSLDIPTAADAKAIIEKGEYELAKKQGVKIAEKINAAIALGNRAIEVSALDPVVQNYLEGKGYKVEHSSGGDMRDPYPPAWYISWH